MYRLNTTRLNFAKETQMKAKAAELFVRVFLAYVANQKYPQQFFARLQACSLACIQGLK
jgi:hypothetical protein